MQYDVARIREDFPILSRDVYGKPLVYLDNGATTQKPRCVVDAIVNEYYSVNANVHRGVHFLSQQATELHEAARETVRRFINARSTREIVFTRGTTESINLVASSFVAGQMKPGDEVIVSLMEHHSNIVPWQLQAERSGIVIRVIPIDDRGELMEDALEQLFTPRTKLVSVAHVSNVLGTVNPVERIVARAHAHGVPVWWTEPRRFLISRWTFRNWMLTFMCSADTRSMVRQESVYSMGKKNGLTVCRLIRVEEK